jgi:GH18 family chitinase
LKKNYITPTNVYFDNVSKSPYIFDAAKGLYISFDDQRSIAEKINLIKNNGFGGLFSWEMSGDADDFELTAAMG